MIVFDYDFIVQNLLFVSKIIGKFVFVEWKDKVSVWYVNASK